MSMTISWSIQLVLVEGNAVLSFGPQVILVILSERTFEVVGFVTLGGQRLERTQSASPFNGHYAGEVFGTQNCELTWHLPSSATTLKTKEKLFIFLLMVTTT